jgi:TP53 regulating kinase-like protein
MHNTTPNQSISYPQENWKEFAEAQLLFQGAEARIYKGKFVNRTVIIKERFSKNYRHPTLDERLNSKRLNAEVRAMTKTRSWGVDSPTIYFVDRKNKLIYMEYVEGRTVKQYIIENPNMSTEVQNDLAQKIGHNIALLHNAGLIHGDLTTSNFLLRNNTQTLVVIDFGLSFVSKLAEDKAVDLYVLERAFLSTHPNSEPLFELILKAYGDKARNGKEVLHKLDQVRLRGRKKIAFG